MRQLSIKQATLDVVKSMPETSSVEDVMYQINLIAKAVEGVNDIKDGRTSTTSELLDKVNKWETEQ